MKAYWACLPIAVKHYISFAMKPAPVLRKTGRPLSFDRDAALEAAMHQFWRHGFEGTSISQLTRAMGITPPSLYAAFGDKRRLFLEAVDRYLGGAGSILQAISDAPSARAAAHQLLIAGAIGNTGATTPPGCLLAGSIVCSSESAAGVREDLATIRRDVELALRRRIERDVEDGTMPANTDAEMLAGHAFAVLQGMSTLAKDGADRGKLLRIAENCMAAWPQ